MSGFGQPALSDGSRCSPANRTKVSKPGAMRSPMGWAERKADADTCWPDVEAIIRRVAGRIIRIEPGSPHEDRDLGRDYIVASGAIACRLRRPDCWRFRGQDITIRLGCPGQRFPTELAKCMRGDINWMLTGWRLPEAPSKVPAWIFSDVQRIVGTALHEDAPVMRNRTPPYEEFIAIATQDLL